MKGKLWLVGLGLVIIGGLGFGYAGIASSKAAWIISSIIMAAGGAVYIASYVMYRNAT